MTATTSTSLAPSAAASGPSPAWASSIRGAGLLLAGRFLNIGSQLVLQVVLVRAYAPESFGAYAYGLAVVSFLAVAVGLGLDQSIQRVATLYEATDRRRHIAGAVALQTLVVVVAGGLIVAALSIPVLPLDRFAPTPEAALVLRVFALQIPVVALDTMMLNLFAVYSDPRRMFLRKYVLAPGLRITAVVGSVLAGFDITTTVGAVVLANVAGFVAYLPRLRATLAENGVRLRDASPAEAWRDVSRFAGAAFLADVVVIALFASDALLLGAFAGAEANAVLGSFQPVATGVQFIFYAVIPLYLPAATRAFATGAIDDLRELYRRCQLWIVVFSTPVLLAATALAPAVATFLYGEAYGDRWPVLALMVVGQFVLAVWGLTALTLKAVGHLRALAMLNVGLLVVNLGANAALAARYGAAGVAAGTTATLIVLSAGKAVLVRRHLGIPVADGIVLRALAVQAAAVAVLAVATAVGLALPLLVALVVVASGVVVAAVRPSLGFGEVMRLRHDEQGSPAGGRPARVEVGGVGALRGQDDVEAVERDSRQRVLVEDADPVG